MLEYYNAPHGEASCFYRAPDAVREEMRELSHTLADAKRRLSLLVENRDSFSELYGEDALYEDGAMEELCGFLCEETEEAERIVQHLRDELHALREELEDSLWYAKGRA